MVDELVKARIPKPTATRLVDRIDRGNLEPDNPKWINLENGVQDLKSGVQVLESDVQDLKSDVQVLESDVQDLKSDVQVLKSDVQDLKSGVQVLESDVQDLKSDVGVLQKDVGFVKNDVRWLKWAIALGFSALVALMFGIVGIVTYLHNDMKAEIRSVRTEMKTEINSLRTEMQLMQKEINAKIDQILLQRR